MEKKHDMLGQNKSCYSWPGPVRSATRLEKQQRAVGYGTWATHGSGLPRRLAGFVGWSRRVRGAAAPSRFEKDEE